LYSKSPIFSLKLSGVQVSINRNDTMEVPADWLVEKRSRDLLRKYALGAIKAAGRATKKKGRGRVAVYLNGSSIK